MTPEQILVIRTGAATWHVRRGRRKLLATATTLQDAIETGRDIARRDGAELVWQSSSGMIKGRIACTSTNTTQPT